MQQLITQYPVMITRQLSSAVHMIILSPFLFYKKNIKNFVLISENKSSTTSQFYHKSIYFI